MDDVWGFSKRLNSIDKIKPLPIQLGLHLDHIWYTYILSFSTDSCRVRFLSEKLGT